MTLYHLLLKSTGLSQREAADFHKADERTVRRWVAGQFQPPDGVMHELFALIDRQKRAAEEALSVIQQQAAEHGVAEAIDLTLSDDDGAQQRVWPCASAQAATMRRLIEIAPPEIRARLGLRPTP